MDKRSAHLSTRVTPELEIAARAIADLDHGGSVSDLLCSLLEEHVRAKREAFLQLSRVFGAREDLPDISAGREPGPTIKTSTRIDR